VFFANSGSEAIDTAAKLVWYYQNAMGRPKKKKLVAREKAYHGSTIVSGSLTGLPRMHGQFDMPVTGIVRVPAPHFWRAGLNGESEAEFCERIVRETCDIILREDPETVGAFFAEPLQAAGGVILPPAGYHRQIQSFCRAHDILYIADEVVCGFGRTGQMWGSDTYDIQPDMMTCAKAMSSSYLPISALLVTEDVFEALRLQSERTGQFGHGFTYSGHPVCAAVALETLKIYEERNIVERVQSLSPALLGGLAKFSEHPLVGEVRGIGLIAAVELVSDKSSKTPFASEQAVGAKVQAAAQQEGLLVRALGDSIAFCPPLIIDEQEIAEICDRFGKALNLVLSAMPSQS
jgi:4-aminobutyrate--pyruvate transaminase